MLRTAKSCGPDAPTLASSLRRHVGPTGFWHAISANDGGKQARSPGRARRKPLKPLRAGTPGDSGVLVYSCAFYQCKAHTRLRVQRASGVPHALLGRKIQQRLGRICVARMRTHAYPSVRSVSPAFRNAVNAAKPGAPILQEIASNGWRFGPQWPKASPTHSHPPSARTCICRARSFDPLGSRLI